MSSSFGQQAIEMEDSKKDRRSWAEAVKDHRLKMASYVKETKGHNWIPSVFKRRGSNTSIGATTPPIIDANGTRVDVDATPIQAKASSIRQASAYHSEFRREFSSARKAMQTPEYHDRFSKARKELSTYYAAFDGECSTAKKIIQSPKDEAITEQRQPSTYREEFERGFSTVKKFIQTPKDEISIEHKQLSAEEEFERGFGTVKVIQTPKEEVKTEQKRLSVYYPKSERESDTVKKTTYIPKHAISAETKKLSVYYPKSERESSTAKKTTYTPKHTPSAEKQQLSIYCPNSAGESSIIKRTIKPIDDKVRIYQAAFYDDDSEDESFTIAKRILAPRLEVSTERAQVSDHNAEFEASSTTIKKTIRFLDEVSIKETSSHKNDFEKGSLAIKKVRTPRNETNTEQKQASSVDDEFRRGSNTIKKTNKAVETAASTVRRSSALHRECLRNFSTIGRVIQAHQLGSSPELILRNNSLYDNNPITPAAKDPSKVWAMYYQIVIMSPNSAQNYIITNLERGNGKFKDCREAVQFYAFLSPNSAQDAFLKKMLKLCFHAGDQYYSRIPAVDGCMDEEEIHDLAKDDGLTNEVTYSSAAVGDMHKENICYEVADRYIVREGIYNSRIDGGMDEKEVHNPADKEKKARDDAWLRRNPDFIYRPRRAAELETPCAKVQKSREDRMSSSTATVIRMPRYEEGPIPVEEPASNVGGTEKIEQEKERVIEVQENGTGEKTASAPCQLSVGWMGLDWAGKKNTSANTVIGSTAPQRVSMIEM
ncbi:hypothetical protein PVAG01_01918 [Phlyctema vagabunda]|uniref:Uncharacterized protein n=1 Tax=Phlyctema vagabunda TaxID=108571 RepID=A0ABR4PYR1_9HELO